jgi:hypothetical protein
MNMRLVVLCFAMILHGCAASGESAPTLDVYGTYFPGWLVSMALGVAITLIVRAVLIALRLHAYLRPLPLVYLAIWALSTIGAGALICQR